ncbi:MAG: helix-turn-helix domain-containing protein [Aquirufa sp.]
MKRFKGQITFIVEITKTGYSAYSEENILSTGKNIYELTSNLVEASNLYFEDEGFIIGIDQIKLTFNFKEFFKAYRVINAHFLAKKIGLNPTLLSQYVNGQKEPSKKQCQKIIEGLQSIGKELMGIDLI